ncbi:hypothetical protein C8R44DRAFT_740656 [Mycena epipterygia]|nr:hypothetical protein C8R44DRAFT_740656 [Mycena epipterygia]
MCCRMIYSHKLFFGGFDTWSSGICTCLRFDIDQYSGLKPKWVTRYRPDPDDEGEVSLHSVVRTVWRSSKVNIATLREAEDSWASQDRDMRLRLGSSGTHWKPKIDFISRSKSSTKSEAHKGYPPEDAETQGQKGLRAPISLFGMCLDDSENAFNTVEKNTGFLEGHEEEED